MSAIRTMPLNLSFPYRIFTDGAAKGRNGHGPASSGFVVYDRERKIYTFATPIGNRTNNYAEYQALIFALNWVIAELPQGMRCIHFKTDSEFMAHQINRIYSVKSAAIQGMYDMVMARLGKLDAWKVEHVRREFNKEADAACNEALKRGFFETDERV